MNLRVTLSAMSVVTRQFLEEQEFELLAPYAVKSAEAGAREVGERPDHLRTEFQRDRDRILHCSAFRKLEYKTQVYVTHEGDFFRTRLTHTLEVAQIARTVARCLRLNTDLTEAIALAHDLGHTPFGHTGEKVLGELLAAEGGFEHNAQSLRVVEVLEDRFHDRPGLNLTWDVRAGIAHHSTATENPTVSRYLDGQQPSLEGQLVDLADEIAYNHHDIDDALTMGLLQENDLQAVDWVWEIWQDERQRLSPETATKYGKYRALGALMNLLVTDLVETTQARLEQNRIESPRRVIENPLRLMAFSESMQRNQAELRQFLMENVYQHPLTLRMQTKAAGFLHRLFNHYEQKAQLLPLAFQANIERWGLRRVLTDYLSGMTDRALIEDYMAHFDPAPRWFK